MVKQLITSFCLLLVMFGCASLPEDLGKSEVDEYLGERGRAVPSPDDRSEPISRPLSVSDAVQIAMLRSPTLKAQYTRLGLTAAAVYSGSRIRNPLLEFANLNPNRGPDQNRETIAIVTTLSDVFTLKARTRLATLEWNLEKERIAADILMTAAQVERAFYDYVGAQQIARMRGQIAKAGDISYRMAQRYRKAGNLNARDLALEKAAAAELALSAKEAQMDAVGKRRALADLLGLSMQDAWSTETSLLKPPEDEDSLDELLSLAEANRLDLQGAMTQVDLMEDRLQVTGWTRILDEVELGYEYEEESDGTIFQGPVVSWRPPVFNQGKDQILEQRAEYQHAVFDMEQLKIQIDNEVRMGFAAIQNIKEQLVIYEEALIPATVEAAVRAQEQEAFMLIGIFELLQTKIQEYEARQRYLEALRDYWVTKTGLTRTVGRVLPSTLETEPVAISLEAFVGSPTEGSKHKHHHNHPQDTGESEPDVDHDHGEKP